MVDMDRRWRGGSPVESNQERKWVEGGGPQCLGNARHEEKNDTLLQLALPWLA